MSGNAGGRCMRLRGFAKDDICIAPSDEEIVKQFSRIGLKPSDGRSSNGRLDDIPHDVLLPLKPSDGRSSNGQLYDIPHDVLLHEILPQLPLPTLAHMHLLSSSYYRNPFLTSSSPLWQAWCSRQYCWLVMVRKTPGVAFHKEFFACCIPARADGSPLYEGHYWIPLSHALSPCASASPSCLHHISLRVSNPASWYWFDDSCSLSSCLISGSQGLLCLLLHPLHNAPPSSSSPFVSDVLEERALAPTVFNLASCTVLLVNIFTGNVKVLPSPHFSLPLDPRPKPFPHRKFFLSLHVPKSASNSYQILIHDQYFIYAELYCSQTGSWTVLATPDLIVQHGICSYDVKCTQNIHAGDVFGLSSGIDHDAVVAYSWESNEWSMVSAYPPQNIEPAHVFKYDGKIFLAAALDAEPSRGNPPPLVVALWELRPVTPSDEDFGEFSHKWVLVTQGPPPEFGWTEWDCKVLCSYEFEVNFLNFKSLLCITGAVYNVNYHYGGSYLTPILYDMVNKSWFLLSHKGSNDVLGLFAFHPGCSSVV